VVGDLHLTLALGVCAGVSFFCALAFGNAQLHRSRELPYLFWLTVLFAAGIPLAIWRGGSFNLFAQVWLKTLSIFFLLTQTLLSIARIRAILWAIVLSELAVCAYSILHPDQSAWVGDRMSGVSQGILGWNFLGIAAALTVPYIAVLFIDRPSFLKTTVLAAAMLAMLWMVVLTGSRSGLLVLSFSVAATWWMVLRGTPRGRVIGGLLAVVLVVVCCAAPRVLWQRMETMWSSSSPATTDAASAEMSSDERQMALRRSIRYTIDHPLLGLGLGNFEVESGTEPGQQSSWLGTHNSFTELSSEAGIPALIVFLALLFSTLKNMHRLGGSHSEGSETGEIERMARATFASVLSFIVGAFFAHISYEYFLYYPIAIAAGVEYLAETAPVAQVKEAHGGAEVEAA
jgi:O-antigen ligase